MLTLKLLPRSRSFKITDFGTSQKLICDFLHSVQLPPILHRFRDIALERSKINHSFIHSFIYLWNINSQDNDTSQQFHRTPRQTRNSSGDEIANVNFLYDDIVHVLQNRPTIDSCINSATDRRVGYVLKRVFTRFSEITQCNGQYAVQGHSRSPILVPVESSYDFLLVINTNLPSILHRFQVMADYSSNFR